MRMTGIVHDRLAVIERHVRGARVLDVGCVDAWLAREPTPERLAHHPDLLFRRMAAVSGDLLGVDIDAEGIETLRREGHNVVCADAVDVDLGVRFDTIVAGEVIEHVSNVGLFLANLARHLAPGGTLIITTPNPFYSRQVGWIWRYGRPRAHEDHAAWFDPITLSAALRRAGLEVFEAYWVQPRKGRWKAWRQLFRSYFSHSFMVLARRASTA